MVTITKTLSEFPEYLALSQFRCHGAKFYVGLESSEIPKRISRLIVELDQG
jgi:hypothetical protein